MKNNLNNLLIINDSGGDNIQLKDNSKQITGGTSFTFAEACFGSNVEAALISYIRENKKSLIFGCVAWLTSMPILKELATCNNVQILLQKEDLWRPDYGKHNDWGWRSELQNAYKALRFGYTRHALKYPINELSVCGDPSIEAVRCLGNYNSNKKPAFPRMHHKFLVFCDYVVENGEMKYWPVSIWTGSFNFTENSTYSFENALYLEDRSGQNLLIKAYLDEHHQLFAISESLNWEYEWVLPEYRIGT